MRIMGVDPGGTTGVVVWDDSNGGSVVVAEELKVLYDQEVEGHGWRYQEYVVALTVVQYAIDYEVDLIAMEDFVLRSPQGGSGWSSARSGTAPLRIQSLIGLGVWVHEDLSDFVPIWYQQASLAKSAYPNDRLKAAGGWIVGKEHCRDAARHALTAYKRVTNAAIVKKAGGTKAPVKKKAVAKKRAFGG